MSLLSSHVLITKSVSVGHLLYIIITIYIHVLYWTFILYCSTVILCNTFTVSYIPLFLFHLRIQKELLARILAGQTCDQSHNKVCKPVKPASSSDSGVIDLVRKELFQQAMLLLKEDQHKEEDDNGGLQQQDDIHQNVELEEDYSFSFESYTPEESPQQHVIVTPTPSLPSSPVLPEEPQFDIIPTPQPSPVLIPKGNHDTTNETISTPDLVRTTCVYHFLLIT